MSFLRGIPTHLPSMLFLEGPHQMAAFQFRCCFERARLQPRHYDPPQIRALAPEGIRPTETALRQSNTDDLALVRFPSTQLHSWRCIADAQQNLLHRESDDPRTPPPKHRRSSQDISSPYTRSRP